MDIGRIPGLDYIKEEGGFLKIGALVREAALEASELVREKYPILADTAAVIADPLVRNLATVAGNLAHGDPANDHPATMLALGAEVVATGPKGERTIPMSGFFKGLFTTALEPDEILTEIRIPVPPARSGGRLREARAQGRRLRHRGGGRLLVLDASGAFEKAGIGLTNVGPTPVKAAKAESTCRARRRTRSRRRRASPRPPGPGGRPARLGGVQEGDGARADRARPEKASERAGGR